MREIYRLKSSQVKKTGMADGTYCDGGGLYLIVRQGNPTWIFRYMLNRKLTRLGLGNVRDLGLKEARTLAETFRKGIALGELPTPPRKAARPAQPAPAKKARTFEAALRDYLIAHQAEWKNAKHAKQWTATLETHAKPLLVKAVADITVQDVTDLLQPIWQTKAETARRVRQRIDSVLSREIALGSRQGPNPAAWGDNLEHILPKHKEKQEGFAAVPEKEAPVLFGKVWERRKQSTAAACLALTVLTAARSGEMRQLQWDWMDLGARLITLPASIMKAGRAHVIPLSDAALDLLKGIPRTDSPLVFPSATSRPLSDMVLTGYQRKLGYGHYTVHGWRSCFRTVMAERGHNRDLLEFSLAHQLPNAVEAAYMRSTLVDGRKPIMKAWADFLSNSSV